MNRNTWIALAACVAAVLLLIIGAWDRFGPGAKPKEGSGEPASEGKVQSPPSSPPTPPSGGGHEPSAVAVPDDDAPIDDVAKPDPGVNPDLERRKAEVDALFGEDGTPPSVWPTSTQGLKAAMAEAKPKLQDCYDSWLALHPDLQGHLSVLLLIEDRDDIGEVTSAEIVEGTLDHQPLESCILNVLGELQFDPPEDPLKVKWPLEFTLDEPR